MYLTIDTSGEKALVALGDQRGLVSFGEWENGQDLSNKLQPEVEKILKISHHQPQAIICVTGPGSFTGLRIGVATANALAYAWQVPVVGIPQFEIYESQDISEPYVILLKNIHDLAYAKICQAGNCEYFVGNLKKIASKAKTASIGGEYLQYRDGIKENFADRQLIGSGKTIEGQPRAELILRLGHEALVQIGADKFSLPAAPLYINPPNITKPKNN